MTPDDSLDVAVRLGVSPDPMPILGGCEFNASTCPPPQLPATGAPVAAVGAIGLTVAAVGVLLVTRSKGVTR